MTNLTNQNRNPLVVPNAEAAIEQMKLEIAQELGIELGADTPSRLNGRVGAEMTKRLVALGEQYLAEQSINNSTMSQYKNTQQELH